MSDEAGRALSPTLRRRSGPASGSATDESDAAVLLDLLRETPRVAVALTPQRAPHDAIAGSMQYAGIGYHAGR